MRTELTFESLVSEIDTFVEFRPQDIHRAGERGVILSKIIAALKDATKFDQKKSKEMNKLASAVDRAATRLAQSTLNFKQGGILRADWARFARRDMHRLKDELMAFREFMLANAAAFKSAMLACGSVNNINLENLVKELHEERAISERTFVLLMAYLTQPKKSDFKHSTTVAQLSRISAYLAELQEIRRADENVQQKG